MRRGRSDLLFKIAASPLEEESLNRLNQAKSNPSTPTAGDLLEVG